VQVYAKAAATYDAKAIERGEVPPGQRSEQDDASRAGVVSASMGVQPASRRRSIGGDD
jgi:hypothetical protein